MKNNKGQALVEFIIILPVIIFIIMGLVDTIVIFTHKNNAESKMADVIELYKNNESDENITKFIQKDLKSASFKSNKDAKYSYLEITDNYEFITPGLSTILGNPYKITTERVILNEK